VCKFISYKAAWYRLSFALGVCGA